MLVGTPSVFVRTAGCNLRCVWCDTPYASWQPEGEERSVADLVEEIARFGCRHVVVTGGEPLIAPEIVPLTKELKHLGHHVTVETAGTVSQEITCDLLSLSPKLSNSAPRGVVRKRHEAKRLNLSVLRTFVNKYDYQLKFVVEGDSDVGEVEEILAQLPGVDRGRVYLMPQARTREELAARSPQVVEWCKERGFRFSPRLHIELYGNIRGV